MSLMIDRFFLSRLESLSADAPSLPNLPRAVKGRICVFRGCIFRSSLRSSLHLLPLQPQTRPGSRFKVGASYCFVEVCARAGETHYLPLDPHPVRLLPRPHGLASSRFQPLFGKVPDLPKNRPPPPRSMIADVRFGVFH